MGHDVKYCMVNSTFMARELMEANMLESLLGNRYTMEAFKTLSLKFEYHSCHMSPYESTLSSSRV